jgi:peroxiredoxin
MIGRHASTLSLGLLLVLTVSCTPPAPAENIPAPPFDLADMAGGRLTLESLKGKVVVLDFWATWCGPCLVEIPDYAELWRKNHGRGVEIVGVACESDAQDVLDMIREYQMPYRLALSDGHIQDAYGAEGLPTTFVIDGKGTIRKRFVGATPGKPEKLQKLIDELIAS